MAQQAAAYLTLHFPNFKNTYGIFFNVHSANGGQPHVPVNCVCGIQGGHGQPSDKYAESPADILTCYGAYDAINQVNINAGRRDVARQTLGRQTHRHILARIGVNDPGYMGYQRSENGTVYLTGAVIEIKKRLYLQDFNDVTAKLARTRAQRAQARAQAQAAQAAQAQAQAQAQEERDALTEQVEELQEELERIGQELQQLQNDSDAIQQENDQLQTQMGQTLFGQQIVAHAMRFLQDPQALQQLGQAGLAQLQQGGNNIMLPLNLPQVAALPGLVMNNNLAGLSNNANMPGLPNNEGPNDANNMPAAFPGVANVPDAGAANQ